jgi:hypothetical protein
LYEVTYAALKGMAARRNKDIRKELVTHLGEENIGYWALLDQIVYLEGCLM